MFKWTHCLNHVWPQTTIQVKNKYKNEEQKDGLKEELNKFRKENINGARWRGYLHNQQR